MALNSYLQTPTQLIKI